MPEFEGMNAQPSAFHSNVGSRCKPRIVDVGAIERLGRVDCIDRWWQMFGVIPPKYTSLEFMRKALSYEVQVKAFGGHSNSVQRALKASFKTVRNEAENVSSVDLSVNAHEPTAAVFTPCAEPNGAIERPAPNALQSIRPTKSSVLSIRAGTHLVREWNGRIYQVEALEKGFQLDGKTYRSLSAIAKKITGAHWSGPRFFGLES